MYTHYLPLSPSDRQKLYLEIKDISYEILAESGVSLENHISIYNAFCQGTDSTPPQEFPLYLEYREKNPCTVKQLINNTFEIYELICQKRIEAYVKKEMSDFQKRLEAERYKKRLSKTQLKQIAEIYTFDNTLTDLEEIAIYEGKAYFLLLYNLLIKLNDYLYIIAERFDNTSTLYSLSTYPDDIMKKLTQSKRSGNEYNYDEAVFHKRILDSMKENPIDGFAMANSLRVSELDSIREIVGDDRRWHLVKNNKNFYRDVDKVNFTKKEMLDGFKSLFYSYFLIKYEKRKLYIKKFNKTTIRKIDCFLVKKENIYTSLKNIFNFTFKEKKELKSAYKKAVPVYLLKYYNGIPIYTTKDVKPLNDAFFDFYMKEVIQSTELKAKIILKREFFYWQFSQIRARFY